MSEISSKTTSKKVNVRYTVPFANFIQTYLMGKGGLSQLVAYAYKHVNMTYAYNLERMVNQYMSSKLLREKVTENGKTVYMYHKKGVKTTISISADMYNWLQENKSPMMAESDILMAFVFVLYVEAKLGTDANAHDTIQELLNGRDM